MYLDTQVPLQKLPDGKVEISLRTNNALGNPIADCYYVLDKIFSFQKVNSNDLVIVKILRINRQQGLITFKNN